MKNSWFIFAHVINSFEKNDFKRDLNKIKRNLTENTDTYVLRIYNKKLAKVFYITNESVTEIYNLRQEKRNQKSWLLHLVNYIKVYAKDHDSKITGLSYYGHGGSFVLGPWHDPFMTLTSFTKIFIKTLRPKIMCFDSCYMGTIACFYEISKYCRYVIASPSWHPYKSICTLHTFGKLKDRDRDESEWKQYITKMTCEYTDDPSNPKYSCLVGFDLLNLKSIIKKVKTLTFNESTQLKQHDNYQHDLYLALSLEPEIQKKIKEIVITPECIDKCPPRIHGMSIRIPDSKDPWHRFFVKTKWSKVLRRIKIQK